MACNAANSKILKMLFDAIAGQSQKIYVKKINWFSIKTYLHLCSVHWATYWVSLTWVPQVGLPCINDTEKKKKKSKFSL